MNDDCILCLEESREAMQLTVTHLDRELHKIRAGKATPDMLEGVKIEYYGTITPLIQVSNITTPDPKQIIVQPWDKSVLNVIEKAIMAANLGFNPINNGEVLRIIVPALTEERRRDLARQVRIEAEKTKVSVRNIRREANEAARKLKNEGTPEDDIEKLESEIQEMTNEYIQKIDKIIEIKEKEIMTV
jgi:ribosome recycling factor